MPLHTVDISEPPILFHAADAIAIPVNAEPEKSYTPVRIFVAEDVRTTRLSPQVNPSDFARRVGIWQTALTSESPELGIDYEISPWIAAGVRAGDARFIQEEHISHLESKAGGYGHLTSEVTETALVDPFANWACAAATYTPNPGERMEYSFTAAAGDIFLSGLSPTVLGEAAATYKFSDALGLRASLSYQAAWVTSSAPISDFPQTKSNVANSSVAGSSIQSVTSKLYPSQSLGFSVGVSFHP